MYYTFILCSDDRRLLNCSQMDPAVVSISIDQDQHNDGVHVSLPSLSMTQGE